MRFTHVIFDLDGTLTDPGVGITNSVAYALAKYGVAPPAREELYRFIGPPLINMFMSEYGMTEKDARRTLGYYREYFADRGIYENKLYPGIAGMLEKLSARAGLALATSKPDVYTERILDHFGIGKYFSYVSAVSLDENGPDKSGLILTALKKMGVSPSGRVAMVGDRRFDMEGAVRAGVTPIGALYGFGTEEELLSSGAEMIARDVAELGMILLGN